VGLSKLPVPLLPNPQYHRISLTSSKRESAEHAVILDLQCGLKPKIEKLAKEFKEKYQVVDLPEIQQG
jgi:hypothetical protein